MHIINAQFEITSPMFIGGYNLENSRTFQELSIRPTAIKGALRFWWRALTYPLIRANTTSSQDALKALHSQEMSLFGAAASEHNRKSGQSLVMLRVNQNINSHDCIKPSEDENKGERLTKNKGCQYLLGMGLYHFNQGIQRTYIKTGSQFSLQLAIKPNATNEQIKQLKHTLFVFGLLGNLGSRARKGFGSVQMSQWDVVDYPLSVPRSQDEYAQALKTLFKQAETLKELPPFTAFSAHAMADISCFGPTPVNVINDIGIKQQLYRGYGRNTNGEHKVAGRKALQIFSNDHDDILRYLQGSVVKQPKRVIFGLPHSVRFSDGKKLDLEIANKATSRRASPLFIHVQKLGGMFYAVQSLLAAEFSPSGAKMSYNKKTRNVEPVDWSVITNYMMSEEYQGPNSTCDGFTQRQPIFKGSQL